MMSGSSVSIQCSFVYTIYCGTNRTAAGTIIVDSSIRKIKRFAGNFSFAKANAAMEDESVLNSSTKTVTIKLFLMPLSRFAADQMSR